MKRTGSVSVRVIGVIVVGMAAFSIALFAIVNRQLIFGFENYITKSLAYESTGVQKYIDDNIDDLKRSTASLKDSFYEGYAQYGFKTRFVSDICHNVIKYFDADGAIVVDANGNKESTTSLGSVDFSKYIKRALSGEEVESTFMDGRHLYAVVASPLKVDGQTVGAVVTKKRITNDNFVATIASLYDVEAEYYSG